MVACAGPHDPIMSPAIRERRRAVKQWTRLGWTQAKIAAELGMSRSGVQHDQRWLRANEPWCDMLGCDRRPRWIVRRPGQRPTMWCDQHNVRFNR